LRIFLDSSVFLHLLLDGPRADEAEVILSAVEDGEVDASVTVMVVEEVTYKLLAAKASEFEVAGPLELRRRLLRDGEFRERCLEPVEEFNRYLRGMSGLSWVNVLPVDWEAALDLVRRVGLLPSDAVHASVSLRLGLKMATFDSDFRRVPGLEVLP